MKMNKKTLTIFSLPSLFPVPRSLFPVLCSLFFALCFLSCEQPFKAGLGPIIDLQNPEIELQNPPGQGTFIRGTVTFTGWAKDDTKLDSVYFQILTYDVFERDADGYYKRAYYKLDGYSSILTHSLGTFYKIPDSALKRDGGDRNWRWSFTLDTKTLDETGKRAFDEGRTLLIRMLARDHLLKENLNVLTEYAYVIKNEGPQIHVDEPLVMEELGIGGLGGGLLNYGYFLKQDPQGDELRKIPFRRIIFKGNQMVGRISDDEEINYNEEGPTTVIDDNGVQKQVERFRPSIRFWEVDMSNPKNVWQSGPGMVPPIDPGELPKYLPGYFPTEDEVPWEVLGEDAGIFKEPKLPTEAVFYYDVPDVTGKYYGFEIRAQSKDKVYSSVRYPSEYNNLNVDAASDAVKAQDDYLENSYVLINVREPYETPVLELYGLFNYGDDVTPDEDLQDLRVYNMSSPNSEKGKNYKPMSADPVTKDPVKGKEITKEVIADRNHVYIDKPIATKNGAFILRMKASHSGGIKSAMVFWQKSDDKKNRGRFIWDSADNLPPEWRCRPVPISDPYETWGYNDPDGSITTRSFVYTYYDDPAKDKVPANAHEFVRGRSKIQRYKSTAPDVTWDDNGNRIVMDYDQFPENDGKGGPSYWEDVNSLGEGTYYLKVYATSGSDSRAVPYDLTITIDKEPPDIKLIDIEGKVNPLPDDLKTLETKPALVNGVIRPRFQFSDSRPEDSRFRTGTIPYFTRTDGITGFFPEQAYILIPASNPYTPNSDSNTYNPANDQNKKDMETYLATHLWPEFNIPGSPEAPWTINGLTVSHHGPIVNSSCLFLTSNNESDNRLPLDGALDDGYYRLYVFARDNAFNVRWVSYPIEVKFESDRPTFKVTSNDLGVIEPDYSYDFEQYNWTGDPAKSFIISNDKPPRNRFTANSVIRVEASDDDGLDLGVGAGTTAQPPPPDTNLTSDVSGVVVTITGTTTKQITIDGKETCITEARPEVVTLNDNLIKQAFAPQSEADDGSRIPVKKITGTITQKILLDALKTLPSAYQSVIDLAPPSGDLLPDGIYRIQITIQDSWWAKLVMPDGTPTAANHAFIKKANPAPVSFWIFVDNKKPEVVIDWTQTKNPGSPLSSTELNPVVGAVSDENGPVTLKNWQILDGNSLTLSEKKNEPIQTGNAKPRLVNYLPYDGLAFDKYDEGKWKYNFSYNIDLNGLEPGVGKSGTFYILLTFKDRFDNEYTEKIAYKVDNEKPRITFIPIDTFSRAAFDDVKIPDSLVQLDKTDPGITNNKDRLAVKTVRFSVSVNKNVRGIRWWLIPADAAPDTAGTGFTTTALGGQILSYNAPPSSALPLEGTYYGASAVPNFRGAYGAVYGKNKITVAIDSTKMNPPNGEYRLHIIALDEANNQSEKEPGSNLYQEVFFLQEEDRPYLDWKGIGENSGAAPVTNLEWPDAADDPESVLGSVPIIRGTVWENNGFLGAKDAGFWEGSISVWFAKNGAPPPANWETIVKEGVPLGSYSLGAGWEGPVHVPATRVTTGSVSGLGKGKENISLAILLNSLFPDFGGDGNKRYIVRATDSPVNKYWYDKPIDASGKSDWTEGVPMGVGDTDANDESVRVSRWKQYAFKYDAMPPSVFIDLYGPTKQFGKNFSTDFIPGGYIADANLAKLSYYYQTLKPSDPGYKPNYNKDHPDYAADDQHYYFQYYIDNESTAKRMFQLNPMTTVPGVDLTNHPILVNDDGQPLTAGQLTVVGTGPGGTAPYVPVPPANSALVSGQHIYAITKSPSDKITVYFRIAAGEATSLQGILPVLKFEGLLDGTHTLNVFARDKTGKEGAAYVNFTKDMKPPTIKFTNLLGKNSPYDSTNTSRVHKVTADGVPWWSKDSAQRKDFLFGTSTITKLPLNTISYEKGKDLPELTGVITDTVSYIKIQVKKDANIGPGDVNDENTTPPVPPATTPVHVSSFRYWIDNDTLDDANARYAANIDAIVGMDPADTDTYNKVQSRTARWAINLTENGTILASDPPLYDGVHTIVLTAADVAGMEIPGPEAVAPAKDERYMIAFRVDSKAPAKPNVTPAAAQAGIEVYGNAAAQSATMFTINVTAEDANLDRVEMTITDPEGAKLTTISSDTPAVWSGAPEWTYYHKGAVTGAGMTAPIPSNHTFTEDYILFRGAYDISRNLFIDEPGQPAKPSGKYVVTVVAYDTAGNRSEEYEWGFTYDNSKPVIEFTNPNNDNIQNSATLTPKDFIDDPEKMTTDKTNPFDPGKTEFGDAEPKIRINRLTSQTLSIKGTVTDEYSAIRQVQSRVERWNWLTGAWEQVETWKDVIDSGNKQFQVSWTKNLMGQGGGLDLRDPSTWTPARADPTTTGEGLYRIQIRAKDSSWTNTGSNPNYAAPTWIVDDTGRPTPTDNITWAAANATNVDIGNPVVSQYEYFYLDRNNPVLVMNNINGVPKDATYFPKPAGGFTITGTVTDANRFAKVEVKFESLLGTIEIPTVNAALTALVVEDDGFTNVGDNPARNINQGGVTQKWSAAFTDSAIIEKFVDGRYKVTVTAFDMTGRSTKEERTFILDSTPPGARFTLPAKELKARYRGYGDDSDDPKPTPGTANTNLDGFASVLVNGGETSVITGETWDRPGPVVNGVNLGENGSESGISQMWFRLGFIDNATYNTTTNVFPSKTAIEDDEADLIIAFAAVAVPPRTLTRAQVRGTATSGNLTIKERNDFMDMVSEYVASGDGDNRGNSWFKLGGQHKPTGFIINNPNIYDWRMEIPDRLPIINTTGPNQHPDYQDYEKTRRNGQDITSNHLSGVDLKGAQIGGLKLYGDTIYVKNRQYTVGANAPRQMVRLVEGQGQSGVYRLPLWIRLVDMAGNIAYYCHDIWIYPDGDIPSTTIESPANGTEDKARGGTISVDGVAKSNTSVYDVIFRVFADNVRNTDLSNPTTPTLGTTTPNKPGDAGYNMTLYSPANIPGNLIRVRSSDGFYPYAEQAVVDLLPDTTPTATNYRATQWQKASLTLPGGSGEPLIPWSIMVNSEEQISSLIGTKGFRSAGGTGPNDMIRVWLEVFVFNGEGSPIRSSIYPSSADAVKVPAVLYGDATLGGAKPYVRAFYIKTGGAAITHPNVGDYNGGNDAVNRHANFKWNPENTGLLNGGYKGTGTEVRRDRFAFSFTLAPNPAGTSGVGLGEVSYRIKLDGGAYGGWIPVMNKGDPLPTVANPIRNNGVYIGVRDGGGTAAARYYFEYAVNSRNTANEALFNAINNVNWTNSGGTITVQVRMKDSSTPNPNEAEYSIQVSVDNFAPVADPNYVTNPKVAGTNVDFIGRVYDYATASTATPPPSNDVMNSEYTPRKLSRVIAWFTKGGDTNYVNMKTGDVAGQGGVPALGTTTSMDNVLSGRTISGGGGSSDTVSGITVTNRGNAPNGTTIRYPNMTGTEEPHNAAWVREISESTAKPQTKMVWAPVNSAVYDVRWSFTLDSTMLPDGKLTLHYIVVDAAGNASYYKQEDITVKNKYPEINKVTLYTVNLGIGAAYTQPDQAEYVVNDYRSRMFNNSAATDADAATTGYLNSGFISKNNYIGFKVETVRGNRDLNFRLQHVTRTLVTMDRATVQGLLNARGTANNINLYTIALHGDYSSNNWRALGVHEDSPTIGTHFVLSPAGLIPPATPGGNPTLPDDFKSSTSAKVWKYTLQGSATKGPVIPANQSTDLAVPIVVGPDNFKFDGPNTTNPSSTDFDDIPERDGSHPDVDDTKQDDPTGAIPASKGGTAFFLIRVWDTVEKPANNADETGWVDNQLHDALVVGMNVYKTDTIRPVARLYDLNPYTEMAVTENNPTATIRNALDPVAIGSNIVRGGLYNVGSTNAMIRSGFIDPRITSTALNPSNGLYDNNTKLVGNVPLPDYPLKVATDVVTAGAANDKVSGKIILRGLAWDDQLINQIQVNTGGGWQTILQLDPNTAKMVAAGAGLPAPNQPIAFAAETLNWRTGHTVEWAYVWDTGNNPSSAPVTVMARVIDYKGSPATMESAGIPNDIPNSAFHNQVNVDVVPYITGFERETPKFTTKRSLQGWYSFYQGEQNIKVKGYNFGNAATTITINGTSVGTVTVDSSTQRTFNVPGGASSGPIIMTAPAAYNNSTADVTAGKSWNSEYSAFTPGSELWINRHYAHIWQTNERVGNGTSVAGTIIAGLNQSNGMDTPEVKDGGRATPGMTLQYNGNTPGRLHAAWSVYNLDTVAYGNNAGEYQRLYRAGEPYTHTDIDFYNGTGMASDDRLNMSVIVSYQRDGGPRLVLKAAIEDRDVGGGDDDGWIVGAGPNNNAGTNSTSSDRWKNTRIVKLAASGNTRASNHYNNPGTVFISAFDSYDRRLLYTRQSGTISNSSGAQYGNISTQFFLDGGGIVDTGNNTPNWMGGTSILAAGAINVNTICGPVPRSNSAGQYNAIDYDSGGRPVIAYFDDQNQTLRLLYTTETNPTQANQWTRRYVLPVNDPLRRGSGSYVSMKINRNTTPNQIHLAFYNSNHKAVVYAVGTTTGDFTASVIDRVVEGGQWTDISLDNSGNPWIVYADSTRTTNRDGARLAYRSFNGTDTTAPATAFGRPLTDPISGNSIRGWEALTMPADYKVNNDRLNIEAWPPIGAGSGVLPACPIGGWHAAVGYASDKFRIGYFIKPTGSMTF